MEKLNRFYNWYENLSLDNLDDISRYYSEDAFFKDPFNEFNSREKIKNIFLDMFENLENPQFIFIDKLEQDGQAFVTWNFIFSFKKLNYTIHGSTHLKLDEYEMVYYHRDYWDVGEELLLKIPVIKTLYGALRNKIGNHK